MNKKKWLWIIPLLCFGFFCVVLFSRGIGRARSSGTPPELFLLVTLVCLAVIFAPIIWWLVAITKNQLKRVEAVRAMAGDPVVISAFGGTITQPYLYVSGDAAAPMKRFYSSFPYVVSVGNAGVSFWAGNPRSVDRRVFIPWDMIDSVETGIAVVSRPVPGVALNLSRDGREDQVTFAVSRGGRLSWFAILSEARVAEVAREVAAMHPGSSRVR